MVIATKTTILFYGKMVRFVGFVCYLLRAVTFTYIVISWRVLSQLIK